MHLQIEYENGDRFMFSRPMQRGSAGAARFDAEAQDLFHFVHKSVVAGEPVAAVAPHASAPVRSPANPVLHEMGVAYSPVRLVVRKVQETGDQVDPVSKNLPRTH